MTKLEAFEEGRKEFLKGNKYIPAANSSFITGACKSKIDTATLIGEYYNGFMMEQKKASKDIQI